MAFKLFVVFQSVKAGFISPEEDEIAQVRDGELPVYTILIPLYREEKVINQIAKAMTAIHYPADKLDIIITLEKHDVETLEAIQRAHLPSYFKIFFLPPAGPQTKPKALNAAFKAIRGEFVVIYDAEIVPDPDQLKKAYMAFSRHPDIAVLQTRLDHYNSEQNLITKLFNAEFSFYYDFFLPGLQKLGYPIPLSGHSTHFRYSALRDSGAWDPFNVTEDCDLGIRMCRFGYRTGLLDSASREEATSTLWGWICQRTRWMKGFMQTTIVHMRHPFYFKKQLGGWKNFFAFLFIVPSAVAVNFINFFYWIVLATWMLTHARIIQSFFRHRCYIFQ